MLKNFPNLTNGREYIIQVQQRREKVFLNKDEDKSNKDIMLQLPVHNGDVVDYHHHGGGGGVFYIFNSFLC